jgi:hypothetical protein
MGAMLAMEARRKTGRGQVVDIGLYEPVFRILDELAPAFQHKGYVRERMGPGTVNVVPHSHYPTKDNRWIAIACTSDKIFARLAAAMGAPELGDDGKWGTIRQREAARAEVDAYVGAWTSSFTRDELLAVAGRVRWLVVDVPDKIQFTAVPDAERMKVEVRVRDQSFRAKDDAVVKIEVTAPGGKKSELFAEPSLKEAGLFEAEFYSRETGAYRALAKVELPTEQTEDAEKRSETKATGWVHDPLVAEFASLKPGREWVERVAKASGGRVLSLADLPRLPEILKDIRAPVEETITTPLWHAPWVFAIVLGLLGAELYLRRKGGMA